MNYRMTACVALVMLTTAALTDAASISDDFSYVFNSDPALNRLEAQNPTDWSWFDDGEGMYAYIWETFTDYWGVDRHVARGIDISTGTAVGWYKWDASVFQAVEGHQYTVTITAMANVRYQYYRDTFYIDVGFGKAPASNPDVIENWTMPAGVTTDGFFSAIGVYDRVPGPAGSGGTHIGIPYRSAPDVGLSDPTYKAFEVKCTVMCLAGLADVFSVWAREDGTSTWEVIVDRYPLDEDLDTTAATNYVLLGFRSLKSSEYGWSTAAYDDISFSEQAIADVNMDGNIGPADLAELIAGWTSPYDLMHFAGLAIQWPGTGEDEWQVTWLAGESFQYNYLEELEDKGGALPPGIDGEHGVHWWHVWYGNETTNRPDARYTPVNPPSNDYTYPPGSQDGWVGMPRWTGDNLHAAFAWEGGKFQAQEGYEYVLDARIASSRSEYIGASWYWPGNVPEEDWGGYHEPNLYARPVIGTGIIADVAIGVRPDVEYPNWGYDDYLYFDHVVSLTNDHETLALNAYTAETQNLGSQGSEELVQTLFGYPFPATSWQWYDVRLVVKSLAGEADRADVYARPAGTGDYQAVALNAPLVNDLDTTTANNYPLLALWYWYDNSYSGSTVNWNDYSMIDSCRIGYRPIQDTGYLTGGFDNLSYGDGSDVNNLLDSTTSWSKLYGSGLSTQDVRLRNDSGLMPVSSEDLQVAEAKSVTSDTYPNNYSLYRWTDQAFQAVEGHSYTFESKVLTYRYDAWDPVYGGIGFRAYAAIEKMPTSGDPDDHDAYTMVAGMTDAAFFDDDKIALHIGDAQEPDGYAYTFRVNGVPADLAIETWYQMRMVVHSVAGGPDVADFYMKRSGVDEWQEVANGLTLGSDLDTTAAVNVPVLGVYFRYRASTYDTFYWGVVDHVRFAESQ